MNGFFNTNFLTGMVLARDLPRDEALLVGLTASQFKGPNVLGAVLMKRTIDRRVEFETLNNQAQGQVTALGGQLTAAEEKIKNLEQPIQVNLDRPGYLLSVGDKTPTEWVTKEDPTGMFKISQDDERLQISFVAVAEPKDTTITIEAITGDAKRNLTLTVSAEVIKLLAPEGAPAAGGPGGWAPAGKSSAPGATTPGG